MKNTLLFCAAAFLLCAAGCKKSTEGLLRQSETDSLALAGFTKYTLEKGAHYANGNKAKSVDVSEQKFVVLFDSTAIYTAVLAENQYDINKLFGFSDNNAGHHLFSARIGWRWSDGALRLFGYVYNNGVVSEKEITKVAIGAQTVCSIKVTPGAYIFTINGKTETLERKSTTTTGKGYQLYPYFGGNETAPHAINIWIKGL